MVEDPFGPQPQGAVLDGISGGTWAPTTRSRGARTTRAAARSTPASARPRPSFDGDDCTKHLKGAIDWSAGVSDVHYQRLRRDRAGQLPAGVTGQPNLSEPVGFDQLPDGRIIQTDRRGGMHLHDLADGSRRASSPTIPVYNNSEDGIYGGAVDNNFSTDHWVYLYYAPPIVDNITYSDGTTGHTNNFDAAPAAERDGPDPGDDS